MSNEIVFAGGGALLPQKSTTTEMATTRQAQEVQAAMVIAKKFPRQESEAYARIMRACQRKSLAEVSVYSFPRGGSQVEGPSIRLAECLAQNWGNIDFGILELEQKDGESTVMSYAWDLETNTRQTKVFQVSHSRKARGQVVKLEDPRDIYEMVANQGARRLRACILGVIPGDIVEAAVQACNKTMEGGSKEPLQDRVRKMVAGFGEMGVTVGMLEERLGHNMDATTEIEVVNMRKIYTSLRDGMSKVSDWFKPDAPKAKVGSVEPEDDVDYGTPPPSQCEPPKDDPPQPKKPAATDLLGAPALSVAQAELAAKVHALKGVFDDFREVHIGLGTEGAADWTGFIDVPEAIAAKAVKGKNLSIQIGLARQQRGEK